VKSSVNKIFRKPRRLADWSFETQGGWRGKRRVTKGCKGDERFNL